MGRGYGKIGNSTVEYVPLPLFYPRITLQTDGDKLGLAVFEEVRLRSGNFLNRSRGTMQGDGTLVALDTAFLINLQEERTVAERDTAVDTFSATDTKIIVDHVFEVRRLDFTAANRSGRTKLILRSGVSRNRLRIEKARAEITVSTHLEIVETFDRRNRQDATIGATAAADTAMRINLPSRCVGGHLFLDGKKARQADNSDDRRPTTGRLQKFTPLCVHNV